MTQNLPDKKKKEVYDLLKSNMPVVKNLLPKHLTPMRTLRVFYSAVTRNPDLLNCSHMSLLNCLVESSQLGLEIGGPLGLAYMVPFNNKRSGGKEAQLIPGYQGLMELAYRSGLVTNFSAHPVYEKDTFRYSYGLNPVLEHTPYDGEDPGPLKYAYAICHFSSGGYDFEVVNKRVAMTTKKNSPGARKSDSPWNSADHEWTMWVKTAIRKLFKRVPKSPEIQRAVSLEERAEAGLSQELSHTIDVDFQVNDKEQTTSSVAEKLKQEAAKVKGNGGGEAPELVPCPNRNEEQVLASECPDCKSYKGCPAHV